MSKPIFNVYSIRIGLISSSTSDYVRAELSMFPTRIWFVIKPILLNVQTDLGQCLNRSLFISDPILVTIRLDFGLYPSRFESIFGPALVHIEDRFSIMSISFFLYFRFDFASVPSQWRLVSDLMLDYVYIRPDAA